MTLNLSSSSGATPPTEFESKKDSMQRALENPKSAWSVLQFCATDYDSVCVLRLVSKQWKKATEKLWKSYDDPLQISREFENVSREYDCKVNDGKTKLAQFIEQHHKMVSEKNKYPYRNVILNFPIKKDPLEPYPPGVWDYVDTHLWSLFVQNIAVFTLTDSAVPVVNNQIDPEFQAALPNLERLMLKKCTFYFREYTVQERFEQVQQAILTASWKKLKLVCLEDVRFETHPCLPPQSAYGRLVLAFPKLTQVSVFYKEDKYNVIFKALETSQENNVWVYEAPQEPLCLFDQSEDSSVQRLKIYSGLPTATDVLHPQEMYLDQLCVYLNVVNILRATPFSDSFENLTKLLLFGNVSSSLDFLIGVPKLQEFRWNYDRKGVHVRCSEEKYWRPVDYTAIIQNTTRLEENFRLENLQTLELEWELSLTLNCWEKFSNWMPEVTRLKVTVLGDEQLRLISLKWRRIQHLELAHRSQVSLREIEKLVVLCKDTIQRVIWKPCPCIPNNDVNAETRLAIMALKRLPGSVFP